MFRALRLLALCALIAPSASAGIRTWTGGGFTDWWSNPANWSPEGIPTASDSLVFPVFAVEKTNDLPPGSSVGPMTFYGNHSLTGNALTLTGDLSFPDHRNFTSEIDLKIGQPLRIGTPDAAATTLKFNGALDINGQVLTLSSFEALTQSVNGTGTIRTNGVLSLVSGNFSGTISGGDSGFARMYVNGSFPNATVIAGALYGHGTVGDTTVMDMTNPGELPGRIEPGDNLGPLHTGSLVVNGFFIASFSPTLSKVVVTGTVTLKGPLVVWSVNGAPVAATLGQTFTIIDNDGSDAINGPFPVFAPNMSTQAPRAPVPEGATFEAVGHTFRISYRGGDGNDVVLTKVAPTATLLSQSAGTTKFGEPTTLTATLSSTGGTPTGLVTFAAGGLTLGSSPVEGGKAALTVSSLEVGTHDIVATLAGSGFFADSRSTASHVVARGQTTASLAPSQTNVKYGESVRFTVFVNALAPAAGQVTGLVTFLADGGAIGTAPVVNGRAVFDIASLHPGTRLIAASYGGDSHFESSSAPAIQHTIVKAPAFLDARSGTPIFIGASPVITVSVSATTNAALVPSGSVSVSEGGSPLAQQALLGGNATITLAPLSPGTHHLVVRYGGDGDFEAVSETVMQTVSLPTIAIGGARLVEGNGGTKSVTLPVSLSAAITIPVRVSFFTLGGSATEGVDYAKASGVIEFLPGEQTRAVELNIFGDLLLEADESFSVQLFNPLNSSLHIPSAVIIIENDDSAPARRRSARH